MDELASTAGHRGKRKYFYSSTTYPWVRPDRGAAGCGGARTGRLAEDGRCGSSGGRARLAIGACLRRLMRTRA